MSTRNPAASRAHRLFRDPILPSLLLMGSLVVFGFLMIALGWRAVARTLAIPLQTPGLVSGGLAGIALVGLGLRLIDVQLERRSDAAEDDQMVSIVAELRALIRDGQNLRSQLRRKGRSIQA